MTDGKISHRVRTLVDRFNGPAPHRDRPAPTSIGEEVPAPLMTNGLNEPALPPRPSEAYSTSSTVPACASDFVEGEHAARESQASTEVASIPRPQRHEEPQLPAPEPQPPASEPRPPVLPPRGQYQSIYLGIAVLILVFAFIVKHGGLSWDVPPAIVSADPPYRRWSSDLDMNITVTCTRAQAVDLWLDPPPLSFGPVVSAGDVKSLDLQNVARIPTGPNANPRDMTLQGLPRGNTTVLARCVRSLHEPLSNPDDDGIGTLVLQLVVPEAPRVRVGGLKLSADPCERRSEQEASERPNNTLTAMSVGTSAVLDAVCDTFAWRDGRLPMAYIEVLEDAGLVKRGMQRSMSSRWSSSRPITYHLRVCCTQQEVAGPGDVCTHHRVEVREGASVGIDLGTECVKVAFVTDGVNSDLRAGPTAVRVAERTMVQLLQFQDPQTCAPAGECLPSLACFHCNGTELFGFECRAVQQALNEDTAREWTIWESAKRLRGMRCSHPLVRRWLQRDPAFGSLQCRGNVTSPGDPNDEPVLWIPCSCERGRAGGFAARKPVRGEYVLQRLLEIVVENVVRVNREVGIHAIRTLFPARTGFPARQSAVRSVEQARQTLTKRGVPVRSSFDVLTEPNAAAVFAHFGVEHNCSKARLSGTEPLPVSAEVSTDVACKQPTLQTGSEYTHAVIIDIGHGTTDISFILWTGRSIHASCPGGDPASGGRDLDDALIRLIWKKHVAQHGERRKSLDASAYRWIRPKASDAKHQLTTQKHATVVLRNDLDEAYPTITISRAEAEDAWGQFRLRYIATLVRAIETCGFVHLRHVLLVGGTSKVPAIRRWTEEFFTQRRKEYPDAEVIVMDQPIAAIAYGAGLAAYGSNPRRATTIPVIHGQTAPSTVTVEMWDPDQRRYVGGVLVKQGQGIPMHNATCARLTTSADGQTRACIRVVEGDCETRRASQQDWEQDRLPEDTVCDVLWAEDIPLLPAPRGSVQIAVCADLDKRGQLSLTATCEGTCPGDSSDLLRGRTFDFSTAPKGDGPSAPALGECTPTPPSQDYKPEGFQQCRAPTTCESDAESAPLPRMFVVYVIDTTGSMYRELMSMVKAIAHQVEAFAQGRPLSPEDDAEDMANALRAEVCVGVVQYRDRTRSDRPGEDIMSTNRFYCGPRELDALMKIIRTYSAGGGGDEAELVAEGLDAARDLFHAHALPEVDSAVSPPGMVAILIGDAHNKGGPEPLRDSASKLRDMGVSLCAVQARNAGQASRDFAVVADTSPCVPDLRSNDKGEVPRLNRRVANLEDADLKDLPSRLLAVHVSRASGQRERRCRPDANPTVMVLTSTWGVEKMPYSTAYAT
eukprot:TRINITY_DN4293_c0_g2_i1.p1 TRINITY_DN4293_c0_g2~~TRINITY_DN4293_c0_g2_i1.p1  ORF type:complete len:1337 (-),score=244.04 TRINITY_DN4293_c0_g2_i1:306-4316(-)